MHLLLFIVGCLLLFFVNAQKKDSLLKTLVAEPEDMQIVYAEDGESRSTSGFIPSPLHASKELFYSAISFRFGAGRYRYRGLDPRSFSYRMNGIKMNRLYDQQIPWNDWGGLNESTANQTMVAGVGEEQFGNIGLNNYGLVEASAIRTQKTISLVTSNRAYGNRLSFVHAQGYNKKQWATALHISGRKGGEQIIDGGFFNGISYLMAIQKKYKPIDFNLTLVGAVLDRNTTPATTKEYRLLGGQKTNPYWGWHQGVKKNAGAYFLHQPKMILSAHYSPTEDIHIQSAIMYSEGLQYTTGFDWYQAADPRADYYRYLPSYQNDSLLQHQIQQVILSNPQSLQINWDRIYHINTHNLFTLQGITGNRAKYILESRNRYTKQFFISTQLQQQITATDSWTIAVDISKEYIQLYKRVHDLLGADYYVNWNQFASNNILDSNAMQNDLNEPDRIVYAGDIFGYDYRLHLEEIVGTATWITRKQKLDMHIGGTLNYTQYQRIGNMRNGLFPGNSFGASIPISFWNGGIKFGFTYKQSGNQYFLFNMLALTRAPLVQNTFVAARVNSLLHPALSNEKIFQVEAGWIYNSSNTKLRLNGYILHKYDGIDLISFYHDEYQSLVSYALSELKQMHMGIEASLVYTFTPSLSVEVVALVGDYRFTTTQQYATYIDNQTSPGDKGSVFIKNFKVPGTPQQAFSVGLGYKPGKWWANFAVNYLRDYWLDFNPVRRTYAAGRLQSQTKSNWIFPQEKLPDIFYTDLFVGTSFYLNKKNKQVPIMLFLSVNNCFNHIFYTGGYEQLRFGVNGSGENRFPTKYFLASGINYSLTTRFNF
ncbi:MAG: hypothetical protein K2X26_02680 [Chitinophagaceae bacterium]|nr:hypothetical protein [Chitinophagaceae bacterium]